MAGLTGPLTLQASADGVIEWRAFLLQCECPLLAQSGRADAICYLSAFEAKRTWPGRNSALQRKGPRPAVGRPLLLAPPHACCGVVKKVCCDGSALRPAFNASAAAPAPPKPAIACTSCAA